MKFSLSQKTLDGFTGRLGPFAFVARREGNKVLVAMFCQGSQVNRCQHLVPAGWSEATAIEKSVRASIPTELFVD